MTTTRFPLPDQAFNTLRELNIPDSRRFVFDQPVTVRHGTKETISLFAPSKREAKHDKVTLRASRTNGINPTVAPSYAFRNAGLRYDTWQWRD